MLPEQTWRCLGKSIINIDNFDSWPGNSKQDTMTIEQADYLLPYLENSDREVGGEERAQGGCVRPLPFMIDESNGFQYHSSESSDELLASFHFF